MTKRLGIGVALALGALLTWGVATSVFADETPTPGNDWSEQMWQWCHGTGGQGASGAVYLNPTQATQVATLLGITTDDLLSQRASGKSVFQIALAKDVSEQQVLDAALAPYRDTLALRVKYGRLSQASADQALQQEQERLKTVFSSTATLGDGSLGAGGMMGGYGSGMMGGAGGVMGGAGGMMGGSGGMMGGAGGRGMMGGWW